jgi:hypothetical protein
VRRAGGAAGRRHGERTAAPAPPPPPDRGRAVAFLRDGAAVVVETGTGAERVVAPRGDGPPATAVAWSDDGRALFVAREMEIVRVPAAGGEEVAVAHVRDEANARIGQLETSVLGGALLARTESDGPDPLADARYFEVRLEGGLTIEVGAREFERQAGVRTRPTAAGDEPIVSATNRWRVRVVGQELAEGVGAAGERLAIAPAAGGEERDLVRISDLPRDEGAIFTGLIEDVAWAAPSETILFVAQTDCDPICRGLLFAIEPDGSSMRRLASGVSRVPTETNGSLLAVGEVGPSGPVVVLVDLVTGERRELGAGSAPAWEPGKVTRR